VVKASQKNPAALQVVVLVDRLIHYFIYINIINIISTPSTSSFKMIVYDAIDKTSHKMT